MNKFFIGKLCSFLMLIFLSSSYCFGQGSYNTTNWRFSNPKPFGFTVLDVDFYDNNNVIAVGGDGGIAKSTDAGSTWTYGPFTFISNTGFLTKATMNDVHYTTPTIAYAVGTLGCMAKTTDGGVTWNFVNTPLFAKARNINAVWFLNKDTGYIAGQHNTPDSLPKLYFTRNGGTTWDSINAPQGGKTRVGYINNPNLAPLLWDVTAKDKEIWRIEFLNDSVGYISGSGTNLFPPFPSANAATAAVNPCQPSGNTSTTGSQNAALVWKFTKGTLTDYSLSKERLGYSGINTAAASITCTTTYGSITPQSQQYRAMNIISDSMIVLVSFNNNIVVRVRTGKNDSTQNVATPGLYEKGKYELLNYPFPPTAGPNAGPAIPATQVLLASNPYQVRRASNNKLYAAANFGYVWTSVDTGKNWIREFSLPQNRNYSALGTWALDISPAGKFLSMGTNGVFADSSTGSATWNSTYNTTPLSAGYAKIDFADCNNGIAAGGSAISVTIDGGATWIDKVRTDFAALFYNINGMTYPTTTKAYFAVSNGTLYRSPDKGTTLDPVYSDATYQFNDVAAIGNDSVWVIGYSQFSVAAANRKSTIFRSTNNGATFQAIDVAVTTTTPAFTAPTLSQISFANKNVGYVAGTRNAIYKTTNGGTTWVDISPFPALNFAPTGFPSAFVNYTKIFALNDTTVFAVGNMFTTVNNRRVYKSTNAGTTWVDISGNINAISSGGNINAVLFHDLNNGYVVTPGGGLLKTTDGGTTWALDIAPTNNLFSTMAFAPRTVPASINMPNRKLFVTGATLSGAPIMEYGNPSNVNVNSTETITNATCSNLTAGAITINTTGGIAPYTYSINGGAFQTSNTFTGLTQGVKSITIKDAYCGTLTKNVTIGFTDNLTLTTSPSTDTAVCAGAPIPLVATSNAASFSWSPAAGLSSATINNPIANISANTTYTVTATLNTCVKTRPINITLKPNPIVNAGPDKVIIEGDSVKLEGAGNSLGLITWTPSSTLSNANTLTPTAKPTTTTTYTLKVLDASGCTSTDDVIVTVLPYCAKPMAAFTPNGDGINDRWMATISSTCASKISATIYNRYGQTVYKNDNYLNDWNGTYQGKLLPDGTYYYSVTYQLINGKVITLKGNLTLIR